VVNEGIEIPMSVNRRYATGYRFFTETVDLNPRLRVGLSLRDKRQNLKRDPFRENPEIMGRRF
jgi:hypothetical protein